MSNVPDMKCGCVAGTHPIEDTAMIHGDVETEICDACDGSGNRNGVSDAARAEIESVLPDVTDYSCMSCRGTGEVEIVPPAPTNQLTVVELIALLNNVEDKSLPVDIEGCDCIGDANGIEVGKNFVLITRTI